MKTAHLMKGDKLHQFNKEENEKLTRNKSEIT